MYTYVCSRAEIIKKFHILLLNGPPMGWFCVATEGWVDLGGGERFHLLKVVGCRMAAIS